MHTPEKAARSLHKLAAYSRHRRGLVDIAVLDPGGVGGSVDDADTRLASDRIRFHDLMVVPAEASSRLSLV